ncbi:MAG: acyltransferase [Flavobacteriaceae bacterium]|nr:acyltransferase [Flavobacteriaceae bacterium]
MTFPNKIRYAIFYLIKGWDFALFDKLRVSLVNGLLSKKHKNLFLRSGITIHGFDSLKLGDDVSINHGCFISAVGGLTIGNDVAIGHNTSIITTEHSYNDPEKPIKYQPIIKKAVVLKDNIWVGANVTILAGITIAEGTIIAAGAVVTKDVTQPNTIIGGCPAKFIKNYKDEPQ